MHLDYTFTDPSLLETALTHPSYAEEHPGAAHYERLEFLGDAVIELLSTEILLARLPDASEGRLSQMRSRLVCTAGLARLARWIELAPALRLGRGAAANGERGNEKIHENALEAVVGAVFQDGGLDAARAVFRPLLERAADELPEVVKTAKTRLQELLQASGSPGPAYHEVERTGPDHDPRYAFEVRVGARVLAVGDGRSKQKAQEAAAEAALAALAPGDPGPAADPDPHGASTG